ncbi:DgyrCDS8399 [Dimorphilus gyrociliatus]|uniref:Fibrous sheath-interacting protein 1 n=1 Tax=Dimorphilus gyrociliatus TaxID=2664684 RepID=A0A7I8VVQ9_9ANNE|nr:DgyrCDS8399 [Dimorphilus gyrociliatus]
MLPYLSNEDDYEDFESSRSDVDYIETERTSQIFRIAEPLATERPTEDDFESDDESFGSREMSSLMADTEIEVNSDDEKEIMKQIKEEITMKLKKDMKTELDLIEEKKKNLHEEKLASDEEDEEEIDPKLKEAIIQMKKLDRILKKKVKREKEVKRDRILLERRLKEELQQLANDKGESREVKQNMSKFLALTLPVSHNQGVDVEKDDFSMSPPLSPVFATQPPEQPGSQRSQNTQNSASEKSSERGKSRSNPSQASSTSMKNRRKNFIKRNKELAADAANSIAMTDDEKKRLADLLSDIDNIPDSIEESSVYSGHTLTTVSVPSERGFQPEIEEQERLEAIDSKLKFLLPPEEFDAMTYVSKDSESSKSRIFSRSKKPIIEVDEPGEEVLLWQQRNREESDKLLYIENQLKSLSEAVEEEIESPKLTDEQLLELLEQCNRTISNGESITGSSRSGDTLTNITTPSTNRQPSLPAIDPKGTLITQNINNRSSASSIRSSCSNSSRY